MQTACCRAKNPNPGQLPDSQPPSTIASSFLNFVGFAASGTESN
jgi:hypothetical protein